MMCVFVFRLKNFLKVLYLLYGFFLVVNFFVRFIDVIVVFIFLLDSFFIKSFLVICGGNVLDI